MVECRPSLTTCRPSTTTSVTSAAVAANTTVSSATASVVPAVRTESSRTATRSARAPTAIVPASCQPRAAVTVHGRHRGADRRRRACPAAPTGAARRARAPAPPRTDRSRRANPSRCTGARRGDASSAVGPMPSPRSRSVVGHMHADAPAAASSLDVGVGEVGGVHGRGPLAERTGVGEHARRGRAVDGEARLVLGRSARTV